MIRSLWVAIFVVAASPALCLSNANAEPKPVVEAEVSWAYGMVVDSITVHGNRKTKSYVILREMETRPGDVLDADDIARDLRFIADLSPIATVKIRAEPAAEGHVRLRITVSERAAILVGSVLPVVKYNFETGINYGVRWNERNFRGRLENLSLQYIRNEDDDNDISLGWSTPWIGWYHVSAGTGVRYFNRGRIPTDLEVLERFGVDGFVALPLTESRKQFSQITGSLSFDKSRIGAKDEPTDKETILSPLIGYRFDSRDSRVRPHEGVAYFTSIRASYPIETGRRPYYMFIHIIRAFVPVADKMVLAMLSNLAYQFGDFPDYSALELGGPSSLRGYPTARFRGFHRLFGTIEVRYELIPRREFSVPIIRTFDWGLGLVTFIDGGIVWNRTTEFELERMHGTAGLGFRLYNPIRDVVRIDWGFNLNEPDQLHVSTGIRF